MKHTDTHALTNEEEAEEEEGEEEEEEEVEETTILATSINKSKKPINQMDILSLICTALTDTLTVSLRLEHVRDFSLLFMIFL